jgi:ABC-type antimicrobial peptide transport system permease subunit
LSVLDRTLRLTRRISDIGQPFPRVLSSRAFEVALECLRTDATRTRAVLVAFALSTAILVCLTTLIERGRAATIRALERAGLRNVYLVNRAAGDSIGEHLSAADAIRVGGILRPRRTALVRITRRPSAVPGSDRGAPLYAVAGPLGEIFGVASRSGRLLADLDVDRKGSVCVVGSAVNVSEGSVETGGIVRAGNYSYRVVGRMSDCDSENLSVGEIPSLDWNRAVVVPLGAEPDAAMQSDSRYPVDVAVLAFESVDQADGAAALIERLDPDRFRRGAVRVASPVQTLRQYKQTRRVFDRMIWLVALLTTVSAVIGISNILSASVVARTREIGLRRAMGARTTDIVGQFQAEGIVLGTIGGGVGLLIGIVTSSLLTRSVGPAGVLSMTTLCGLAVGCIVMGVLAGLRPSLKAARIDPAAALREG